MVSYSLHYSGESAVLSFVNWLTLSGAEQSGHRGPSTENQEAKQAAILCIKVRRWERLAHSGWLCCLRWPCFLSAKQRGHETA